MEYVKIGLLILIIAEFAFYLFRKDKKIGIPKMDEYTTERYLSCLGDMINIISRDMFDAKVGYEDSRQLEIITDINDNEEIVKLHDDITKKIYMQISDNMRLYLETYFGKEWLLTYISSTVRNYIIEHTKKLAKRYTGTDE